MIKLGDKRADIEQILGPDELFVAEFEEDNTERVQYYDNYEIPIDYTAEGSICAIRMGNDEWKLFNGLTTGMKAEDVQNHYPAEHIHKYPQTEDLWIAYDASGNTVKFSMDAPYIIRFDFDGGTIIDQILVQDNR